MRPATFSILLFLVISVTLYYPNSDGATRVAVRAVASEQYLKEQVENESSKAETYQFIKGRYFEPSSVNKGMVQFTFEEIALDIAQRLAEQDYYPNPTQGEGDLLIVVHYGITEVGESMQELMGWTSMDDMGLSDQSGSSVESVANSLAQLESVMNSMDTVGSIKEKGAQSNSGLLGMEEAFEGHPHLELSRETELKAMLDEERYFVILMAYDYPKIMNDGKWELEWSTRYSTRAVGKRFEDAIKDMNVVAGGFFGKNVDGLKQRRADDTSKVDVGDIEVLGTENSKTPVKE